MKLSIAEIAVLLDTLAGSLMLQDGGRLFRYTYETRKALLDSLTQQAAQQTLALDEANEPLCVCGKPISRHNGVACLPESPRQ